MSDRDLLRELVHVLAYGGAIVGGPVVWDRDAVGQLVYHVDLVLDGIAEDAETCDVIRRLVEATDAWVRQEDEQ